MLFRSNTTPFLINATNINSNTNGIFTIQSYNFKLNSTATVKIPDLSASLQSFVVGATSSSTAAEFWSYLTANATTPNSLGALIVANLNATVSSRAVPADIPTSNITAIKAKTDNLPSDPASNTQVNTRLASASYTAPDNTTIGTINTKLGTPSTSVSADIATRASQTSVDTVAGYIDTEVAAIKTKTDNLPANTATELSTINTKLDTIDDFIDTEVAAIKTQTDKIPNYPASNESVTSIVANSIQSLP